MSIMLVFVTVNFVTFVSVWVFLLQLDMWRMLYNYCNILNYCVQREHWLMTTYLEKLENFRQLRKSQGEVTEKCKPVEVRLAVSLLDGVQILGQWGL